MGYQIVSLLLEVTFGLLAGACLLRLWMQRLKAPFRNPVGQFVMAITDWLVIPLRRVLPGLGRWDTASLVAAFVLQVVQYSLLWGFVSLSSASSVAQQPSAAVASVVMLALFGLLRLVVGGLMVLLFVYVILSWVRSDNPLGYVLDAIVGPLLRPIRRMIPTVGGFDLSPLVLVVALQIALIVLNNLQASWLR
jgi:YggT family protein